MKINEMLHYLRKREKLTLRQAALKSGLSDSYIRMLEKGIRPNSNTPLTPSPETLKKLAEVYDYSYEELMISAGHLSAQLVLDMDQVNEKVVRYQTVEESRADFEIYKRYMEGDIETLINQTEFLSFEGRYIDSDMRRKIIDMIGILMK